MWFLEEAIVCIGIMVRITEKHPADMTYWWSSSEEYKKDWLPLHLKVDPLQRIPQMHDQFLARSPRQRCQCTPSTSGMGTTRPASA